MNKNDEIQAMREYIYHRAGGVCEWCGKHGNINDFQLAHRIKQGKGSIAFIINIAMDALKIALTQKQAERILHDEKNIKLSCAGYCNDMFNIFNKPVARDALILSIMQKQGYID
jgi:uncharacterized membrane protein